MSDKIKEQGIEAVKKFMMLVELTTEASAGVAHAAAKKGSADVNDISKEADLLFQGFAAISAAGIALVGGLVKARQENEILKAKLAELNGLDKLDSAVLKEGDITSDVKDLLSKYLNPKE